MKRGTVFGLGFAPVIPPVAVSFEPVTNAAGVSQPACTRCGDCVGGCNVGAKNTVALTYLAEAARQGAEIFALAKVSQITKMPDGTWTVAIQRLDITPKTTAIVTIAAPMVILAAGTLGSTELLLRSRDRGLSLSDTIGQRFSAPTMKTCGAKR